MESDPQLEDFMSLVIQTEDMDQVEHLHTMLPQFFNSTARLSVAETALLAKESQIRIRELGKQIEDLKKHLEDRLDKVEHSCSQEGVTWD